MIPTACRNRSLPNADIAVAQYIVPVEQVMDLVVQEQVVHIVESVKLLDRLKAAGTAKPRPAVDRHGGNADPLGQEIEKSDQSLGDDIVGHIPNWDAAVLRKEYHTAVDDANEDAAHYCFGMSRGFECEEC